MSYTTFTANPAALIAQPGRAVNTFPSGLVRVDQTYLGLTSHYATHRATLAVGNDMPNGDSSPCIDGLKIFPEVQERRREDGFTEYLVSAYGRCNSTGSGYMLGWQRSRSFAWHGTWHPNIINPSKNGLVLDCKFSFGNFVQNSTLTKSQFANVYPPDVDTFTNVPTLQISQNVTLSEEFSDSGYDPVTPMCSSVSAVFLKKYGNDLRWAYEFEITVVLSNSINAHYSDGTSYPAYSITAGTPYNLGSLVLYVKPSNQNRTVNYFGDFVEINNVHNFDFTTIDAPGLTSTIPNT